MLEELHPAQVLPVRILHPCFNRIFIAEVECVLQVVKRNHQAGAYAWTTVIGKVKWRGIMRQVYKQ